MIGTSDAADAADEPLRCSANSRVPATAFCTICVQPYSAKFLGVRDDGRAVCFTCARRENIDLPATRAGGVQRDPVLGEGWFRAIMHVITRPHRTFAARYEGAIGAAMLFGYVATVFGFATTTGWNLLFHGSELTQYYVEAAANSNLTLSESSIRRLLWLGIPLISALRFAIGAMLLHLGIRVVVGREGANVRNEVRLFGLASGTLVLCAIPAIGPFLALVTWISACMAYLQVEHGLKTVRGLMAILPSLLVVTALGPSTFVPL